jgi:hypothetical protein
VRDLLTEFDQTITGGSGDSRLIGAYSDAARTVLFVRPGPGPGAREWRLYDDVGFVVAASSSRTLPSGIDLIEFYAPLRPRTGNISDARLVLTTSETTLSAPDTHTTTLAAGGEFDFRLEVQPSHTLAAPAPIQLNGVSFTFDPMIRTPNAVVVTMHETGASIDDLLSGSPTDWYVVHRPDGTVGPIIGAGGLGLEAPKALLSRDSARSLPYKAVVGWEYVGAGRYTLSFNFAGGRAFERVIDLP